MSENFFGTIEFHGEDTAWPPIPFDRLAVGNRGELLFVSVIAPTQIIKGIRGVLNTNKRCTIQAAGVKVRKASESQYYGYTPGHMNRDGDGYHTETHRAGYGNAHAFIWTRTPGFLVSVTEEHLWQELSSTRFTTPLLREWMPWITSQLKQRDLLSEARCYRCECGVLACTTKELDLIVSEGIKDGDILIKKERAVA